MYGHILQAYAQPDWPLIKRFQEGWPEAVVHAPAFPSLRYRTKLQFLAQLPRLFTFGFKTGWQALKGERRPEVFIVGTDPEVFGLWLAQVLRGKRVPIVMVGFIYTLRKAAWLTELRRWYFKLVLSLCTGIICHSTLETTRYKSIFRLKKTKFAVVPFALNVVRPPAEAIREGGYAMSAGRAERDYALLARAWAGMDKQLHIVCDTEAPLQDVPASPHIELFRRCFENDYFLQIAGADFVVVTLKDPELSAGQMVLLQSMSMGKPVIISRTPTTEEYGEHLQTLYFVEHASEQALRDAIRTLEADPALRARIGAAAREHYESRHTVVAYTRGVLGATEQMLA
ncbi:glycosyltransferase [Pelomonas sp. KK5]|uniref:glycosyltransferase n=1 Tax=Pelomonas sp. KK5 TaxID=1855730 RepID=UPI00097BF4B6|nr:glycosyltransferase [Pelomonas sp. KK5]